MKQELSAGPGRSTDPLSLDVLTGVTERKLFGFKCTVAEGTLAEREAERRVRTFLAVLADSRVVLLDTTKDGRHLVSSDMVENGLFDHIRSIYRLGEKEISTRNILEDVMLFLTQHHMRLQFAIGNEKTI